MSRRSRSSTVSTLIHGAASSSASGRASSRRQIAVTMGPFADVRRKSGCTSRTRSTNSRTAGARARSAGDVASTSASNASGPTAYSRSPRTRSGARLVTSTRSAATDVRRSATSGAASRTCSKLSSTSSVGVIVARGPRAPRQVERRDVRHAEGLGNRRRHERRVPNGGQRDEQHTGALCRHRACELQRQTGLPGSSWPGERDETCGGIREPQPQRLQVSIAAEQAVRARGSETPRSSSTAARGSRCPRAPTSASRVAPVRSSAADSARTVSTWGRRRSPRSSALTACTERPAIVASSSCVKPARGGVCANRLAERQRLHGPLHLLPRPAGVVRVLCGFCRWSPARSQSTVALWQTNGRATGVAPEGNVCDVGAHPLAVKVTSHREREK